MNLEVWVVIGGNSSPDKVWGVHFSLDDAMAHAEKLKADGVPALVEVGRLSLRGA